MSSKIVHFCDVCGVQKKDTNHWWDLFVDEDGSSHEKGSLVISPFDGSAEDNHISVCGRECAIKAVSGWFDSGELPEVKED